MDVATTMDVAGMAAAGMAVALMTAALVALAVRMDVAGVAAALIAVALMTVALMVVISMMMLVALMDDIYSRYLCVVKKYLTLSTYVHTGIHTKLCLHCTYAYAVHRSDTSKKSKYYIYTLIISPTLYALSC